MLSFEQTRVRMDMLLVHAKAVQKRAAFKTVNESFNKIFFQ